MAAALTMAWAPGEPAGCLPTVPYLAWLAFAAMLNYRMWQDNQGRADRRLSRWTLPPSEDCSRCGAGAAGWWGPWGSHSHQAACLSSQPRGYQQFQRCSSGLSPHPQKQHPAPSALLEARFWNMNFINQIKCFNFLAVACCLGGTLAVGRARAHPPAGCVRAGSSVGCRLAPLTTLPGKEAACPRWKAADARAENGFSLCPQPGEEVPSTLYACGKSSPGT